VRVGGISHDAARRRSRFWIEPIRDAQGVGIVHTKPGDTVLKVTVGKVTNQDRMRYDLIADLGRSEDPRILWAYQRILAKRNNVEDIPREFFDHASTDRNPGYGDQPLAQKTRDVRSYDCGAALDRFGQILRGTTITIRSEMYVTTNHFHFILRWKIWCGT
jgi:hypothetical protein